MSDATYFKKILFILILLSSCEMESESEAYERGYKDGEAAAWVKAEPKIEKAYKDGIRDGFLKATGLTVQETWMPTLAGVVMVVFGVLSTQLARPRCVERAQLQCTEPRLRRVSRRVFASGSGLFPEGYIDTV